MIGLSMKCRRSVVIYIYSHYCSWKAVEHLAEILCIMMNVVWDDWTTATSSSPYGHWSCVWLLTVNGRYLLINLHKWVDRNATQWCENSHNKLIKLTRKAVLKCALMLLFIFVDAFTMMSMCTFAFWALPMLSGISFHNVQLTKIWFSGV